MISFKRACFYHMCYKETTLTFWATVQKLFKGKGVNFFRGFKGQGLLWESEDAINPNECSINFAVPSDHTLRDFTSKFNMELLHPGVMTTPLEAYCDAFPATNVKHGRCREEDMRLLTP